MLFWQVCEELCSPEDGNTAFTPTLLDSPGHGLDPKPDPEHMKTHLHRLDVLGFVLILCIRCLDFLPDVITPAMYLYVDHRSTLCDWLADCSSSSSVYSQPARR